MYVRKLRRTGNENTKCYEELVGCCECTPDLWRGGLSLILGPKIHNINGTRSISCNLRTNHGHSSAQSADSETTDEPTNGKLWP